MSEIGLVWSNVVLQQCCNPMQPCGLARKRVTFTRSSSRLRGRSAVSCWFWWAGGCHMQVPLHERKKPKPTKTKAKNPKNTEEKTRKKPLTAQKAHSAPPKVSTSAVAIPSHRWRDCSVLGGLRLQDLKCSTEQQSSGARWVLPSAATVEESLACPVLRNFHQAPIRQFGGKT